MTSPDDRMLRFAAATVLAALTVLGFVVGLELVAYLVPLCLLAVPLLVGRYVGEDALERLRERRDRLAPRLRIAASVRRGRRAIPAFPRGGRLIAQALAERGPPVPALT